MNRWAICPIDSQVGRYVLWTLGICYLLKKSSLAFWIGISTVAGWPNKVVKGLPH